MTVRGVRERARAELIVEITQTARRHLAEHGAAGLSVRAVTRDLQMAPSAVYRYFPNRDALLTALITEAYQSLGESAAAAERAGRRDDFAGRWIAVFRAVRAWALAHPHEYALIYGSPVPGYVAPEDTALPASRVALLLARIAVDAGAGPGLDPAPVVPIPADLTADAAGRLAQVLADLAGDPPVASLEVQPSTVLSVIAAWTTLFGAVSFELFGHYRKVVDARASHLDHLARTTGRAVGVPGL